MSTFPTPIMGWQLDTPVPEALGEALGAASVCWVPSPGEPGAVFDSERCSSICDELLGLLQAKLWYNGAGESESESESESERP